jgi:radical SAM superfamily enzyme YgiQ (UPF0313 family)
MKLILIKPNIGRMEHSLYVDEGRMEPLQLGVLAGLTPPDVEVEMYDDRMEEIVYDRSADLAAITVETFTARRAYEISEAFRKRGVPVIMGGMHAKLMPEEILQHADSVYIGDAEYLWQEVIKDVKAGRLKKVYSGGVTMPQPGTLTRRDIFKGKGYLPITLLQFSRGCRFGCAFCATSFYFGRNHTCRSIEQVVAEIETQERKFLFFVDDNIVADPNAAKALFKALIPLKVRWVSQGSINMTQDRELMNLMVKSGCLGHVIGFESLDRRNMHLVQKAPNLGIGSYEQAIKVLREYGLQTWAAFTLGYDYDTVDSVKRTLEFALKNKFAFAAFNILMPYPGTKFYEQLKAQGRLLYDGCWWLHPAYRFNYVAFVPQKMSPEELTEVCFEARKSFNSVGSIVRRAFDFKTNMRNPLRLATYLSYNPLFRREVFKKQGMKFGLGTGKKG